MLRAVHLLTAIWTVVMVAATAPLWFPGDDYPAVPWFAGLVSVPHFVDRLLASGLVLFTSGATLCVLLSLRSNVDDGPPRSSPIQSALTWAGLACLAGSLTLDQHRLQTWAWQFLWIGVIGQWATAGTALRLTRWFFISIYVWSAWSKFDVGFAQTQGPWLWEGLLQSLRVQASAWGPRPSTSLMFLFPGWELLAAVLLAYRRTRRWGVLASAVMHGGLLLTLGPWGREQEWGVLLWNVYFLLAVPLLFWSPKAEPKLAATMSRSDRNCYAVVIGLLVLPVFEGIGWCDHWLAWSVYSSRTEVVRVQVRDSDVARLPASLQPHVGPLEVLDEWRTVSFDAWSLTERHSPIYPQARYRFALAQSLAARGLELRITEQSPANRWTGERTTQDVTDLEATARRYSFSTKARIVGRPSVITTGEWWIARSAQLAVALYAAAVLLSVASRRAGRPSLGFAIAWTAGCGALLGHMLCAFHFLHQWSHAAALRHTVQRTAEVTGWLWSGGLYINYLFLAVWITDVIRVWRQVSTPEAAATPTGRRAIHAIFAFMMFNATVVFGPWHWSFLFGVYLAALSGLWVATTPAGSTRHQ